MRNDKDQLMPSGDTSPAMGLARLEDLDDFKVADGLSAASASTWTAAGCPAARPAATRGGSAGHA